MTEELRAGLSAARKRYESVSQVPQMLLTRMRAGGKDSRTILVLVDGLGYLQLQRYRAHARNLWRWVGESDPAITTAPSTTACAITAITTGQPPAITNMVGYSVYQDGSVFNLLNFAGAPASVDPSRWQPAPTIFERLQVEEPGIKPGDAVAYVPRKYFGSGLTQCALRGARLLEAQTLAAAVEGAINNPYPLSYLYYSQLDAAGHHDGVGSPKWLAALEDLDDQILRLRHSLPSNVNLLLTSDHGMINADLELQVDLDGIPEVNQHLRAVSGEPRALHLHLKDPQSAPQVSAKLRHALLEKTLITFAQERDCYFGGSNSLIGDVVIFSAEAQTVVHSKMQSPAAISMPGVHGSLTQEESLVPLSWIE